MDEGLTSGSLTHGEGSKSRITNLSHKRVLIMSSLPEVCNSFPSRGKDVSVQTGHNIDRCAHVSQSMNCFTTRMTSLSGVKQKSMLSHLSKACFYLKMSTL
jgi:hypothetical protein